jgi:cyclophilin family peptidyl-prolyl cis-trans isomerase
MKVLVKTSLIFSVLFAGSLFLGCSQAGNGGSQTTFEEEQELPAEQPRVKISTDFGDIVVVLYNETPEHRDNFLKLAEEGFFDGTLFHRVINGFMIQGGDPNSKDAQAGQPVGSGGPGYTLPAEFVAAKFHKKGALAAARQGDQINPERRSSGSQFYIVQGRVYRTEELDAIEQQSGKTIPASRREAYTAVGGTPHLDDAYTVFGEVVSGIEVVDQIAATQTGAADRPVEDIRMTVTVIE